VVTAAASPTPSSSATATATRAGSPQATSTAPPVCRGDCNDDRSVNVGELISAVNIALGNASIDTCRAIDADGNQMVAINELIAAVGNALNDCPA